MNYTGKRDKVWGKVEGRGVGRGIREHTIQNT